jgi:DNA (cytosine-5)-methyltransferase 1
MDIDWMVREELSQAIPPAYTEFIGRQLLVAIA